ncbi:MAG: DUF2169 domain-containing protein [Puia sp.]
MELINHTSYPSMMFRSAVENDSLIASAILRVTYDIREDKVVPSPNQEWLLYKAPWESEYGPMEADQIFRLGGVDILVFGKARPKNGLPARNMDVSIKIENKLSYSVRVFGNRFWEKNIFGMTISEPEPFSEMPLTLYNAYGGKADWDGLKLPYGNNPFGKGYYWEREDAIHKPLPNVEDPKDLVSKWNHRPDPVGIASCPMNELRMRGNVTHNEKGMLKNVDARFFNTAFPSMIVPELVAGEEIRIEGMLATGPFFFKIPRHELKVRLRIGEKENERTLKADQIGLIPDKMQAFITYRFPFRYKLQTLQVRKCEIIEIN